MSKVIDDMNRCAEIFKQKILSDMDLMIEFHVSNLNQCFDIIVKDQRVSIVDKQDVPKDIIVSSSEETINLILSGEMEAFTAAGKADMREKAPLDWKIGAKFTPDKMNQIYYFLTHFFTKDRIKTIQLNESASRKVHGANAIPLFYHLGMRSAWYMVKKGERMSEIGDTNPFDQGIVIISGQGKGKIGEDIISLKPNHAYHIPKNSDHVVWNEEETPLVLIWFAWGKGA